MSMLSRKEFKELLIEWNKSLINERDQPEFKGGLSYPVYLITTLNYGDFNYSEDDVTDQWLGQASGAKHNRREYWNQLKKSLSDNNISYEESSGGNPEKIIKVNVKSLSTLKKKELTKKIIDIIYETSRHKEANYLKLSSNSDPDHVTYHPPLNKKQFKSLYKKSLNDIDRVFKSIENSGKFDQPIFIHHDKDVFYAYHDIIGHGSIETHRHDKSVSIDSRNYYNELFRLESQVPEHKRQLISDQLHYLTPDLDDDDISSSLAVYFATIKPQDYKKAIDNFFGEHITNKVDQYIEKKEIIEMLKGLYEKHKEDVERAELTINNTALGRYANFINICFVDLNF